MDFCAWGRSWRIASIAGLLLAALAICGCGHIQSTSQQKVTLLVDPASASVQISKTLKFTVQVSNTSNTAVTWQVNGVTGGDSAHGTIDANGMYTAPKTVPVPPTVTITAISQAQPTALDTAQVTVMAEITVSVSPVTASVQSGKTESVTATVKNDTQNKGVTWTLSGAGCTGAGCGTLSAASSASGAAITYTAPASVPAPAIVTLTAKSVTDTSKTAAATITVTAPPAVGVSVNPTSASVESGKTHSVTATVTNDPQNKGVTWTLTGAGCMGAACGALSAASSASGVAITYTAPAGVPSPATVTLTAKSVADTSKTAVTTITVTAPPAVAVSVNPTSASVQTGKTQSVTATVPNDTQNKGVTWTLRGAGCTGASLRNAVGCVERFGCGNYLYGSGECSGAGGRDADGAVGYGCEQERCYDDHSGTAPPPVGVTVNPISASVQTGLTQSVTATVTNDPQNKGVTWVLTGAGCAGATCGTLSAASSASGVAIVYTAPASVPAPAIVTLTAQSVTDVSKSAVTTITITAAPPVGVAVNPRLRRCRPG